MPRKRLSDFDLTGRRQDLLNIVRAQAADRLSDSLLVVSDRIIDIPEYSCTINIREGEDVTDFMKKWTDKFLNGYENRPSRRTSNPIGTQHDPILDEIISARIQNTTEDLDAIKLDLHCITHLIDSFAQYSANNLQGS